MKYRKYCCDASRLTYENYYKNQVGTGMPIFIGSRNQRGHGLGSVLSGLFRSAAPILKKGLSTLGKSALKTGISIAGDVLEGKNAKESARLRASQGIKNLAREVGFISSDKAPLSEDYDVRVNKKRKFIKNNSNSTSSNSRGGVHKVKKLSRHKVGDALD